jgi:hypothetical protein
MRDPVDAYFDVAAEVGVLARQLREQYDPVKYAQFKSALQSVVAARIAVPYDRRIGIAPFPKREDFFFERQ